MFLTDVAFFSFQRFLVNKTRLTTSWFTKPWPRPPTHRTSRRWAALRRHSEARIPVLLGRNPHLPSYIPHTLISTRSSFFTSSTNPFSPRKKVSSSRRPFSNPTQHPPFSTLSILDLSNNYHRSASASFKLLSHTKAAAAARRPRTSSETWPTTESTESGSLHSLNATTITASAPEASSRARTRSLLEFSSPELAAMRPLANSGQGGFHPRGTNFRKLFHRKTSFAIKLLQSVFAICCPNCALMFNFSLPH